MLFLNRSCAPPPNPTPKKIIFSRKKSWKCFEFFSKKNEKSHIFNEKSYLRFFALDFFFRVEKSLGTANSFDSEKAYLSIGDVFKVIPGLLHMFWSNSVEANGKCPVLQKQLESMISWSQSRPATLKHDLSFRLEEGHWYVYECGPQRSDWIVKNEVLK